MTDSQATQNQATQTQPTYNQAYNQASQNEVSKIQIFRYFAKDKILDLTDLLAFDPKRSKITLSLVEFDETNRAAQRVRHYVDADDMKLICHDLLAGTFTAFEDQKGSTYNDHTEARVLSLKKETKYRQPYVLRIDNGQGEVYGQGQVKMVKATDSLTLQLSEWEARKLALVVLDYIQQWEVIHFRKRQDARTVTFTSNTYAPGG